MQTMIGATLSGFGGNSRLIVNGAIVFDYRGPNVMNMELFLNPWLRRGLNSAHTEGCSLSIASQDLRDPALPPVFIASSPLIPGPFDFTLHNFELPLWSWMMMPRIETSNEIPLRFQLLRATHDIARLLNEKDVDAVTAHCALRVRESALAKFRPLETQQIITRQTFTKVINEPAFRLAPIDWPAARLVVHPGRQLAHLENPSDGKPLIRYVAPAEGMTSYIPMFYQVPAHGMPEVVR